MELGRAAIKIKIFTDTVTVVSQFELEGPENRAKKTDRHSRGTINVHNCECVDKLRPILKAKLFLSE